MSVSKLTPVLAIALLAGMAQAQVITITVPDDIPLPVSKLTRAEVLADLHMWRLSGLQDLNRGEVTPDLNSLENRRAQARYERLIASPQFAALVAKLLQHPHVTVQVSRN